MLRPLFVLAFVAALASCKEKNPDEFDFIAGERRSPLCAQVTIKYLGQQLKGQSTNPNDGRKDQHVAEGRQCWMWTIDVDGDHSKGTLARIDDPAATPITGCAFSGEGPSYEVDLDKGYCAAKTDDGYYRFTLTDVAEAPTEFNGLELDGIIEWSRGEDLLAGPAYVFLSLAPGDFSQRPPYDKRVPVNPLASCRMPACARASFAGKGTVVSGDPLICNDLLTGHAETVPLYFDEHDRMSFAADTPEAERRWGVHGLDSCTVDTWTGSRPYPFARYHVDPGAKTITLEETQLHQANNLSDVCKIRWATSLDACP